MTLLWFGSDMSMSPKAPCVGSSDSVWQYEKAGPLRGAQWVVIRDTVFWREQDSSHGTLVYSLQRVVEREDWATPLALAPCLPMWLILRSTYP